MAISGEILELSFRGLRSAVPKPYTTLNKPYIILMALYNAYSMSLYPAYPRITP